MREPLEYIAQVGEYRKLSFLLDLGPSPAATFY